MNQNFAQHASDDKPCITLEEIQLLKDSYNELHNWEISYLASEELAPEMGQKLEDTIAILHETLFDYSQITDLLDLEDNIFIKNPETEKIELYTGEVTSGSIYIHDNEECNIHSIDGNNLSKEILKERLEAFAQAHNEAYPDRNLPNFVTKITDTLSIELDEQSPADTSPKYESTDLG